MMAISHILSRHPEELGAERRASRRMETITDPAAILRDARATSSRIADASRRRSSILRTAAGGRLCLRMTAQFVAAAAVLASAMIAPPARAETVLRVAMTAGDIPDWTGQPDQGFEGYRFVGWSLYDALINWDLSRSDREAGLAPGLAVKWSIDPGNDRRWIFELRKGVKFHDGCNLDADLVVWNIQRLIDDKTPGFSPVHYARLRARSINVERAEKVDDGTVAIYTKTPDSFLPYNVSVWYLISKCAVEKANFDNSAYAKSPAGTGPYKFDKVVP